MSTYTINFTTSRNGGRRRSADDAPQPTAVWRRDPAASGHPASLLLDPTRGRGEEASRELRREPTASVPEWATANGGLR
jgi:hypothetical protein